MIATGLMPFVEAWEAAEPIFGWLDRSEAALLWDAARHTPEGSLIIEVGAFCGKSTTLLASTGRRIYTVDPLIEGTSIAKRRIGSDVVESLQSVVDAHDNVTWVRSRSTEAAIPTAAAMIYIDAAHNYPHPKKDFEHFFPALRHDTLAAFHDYGREFGVTKSVHELIEEGIIHPLTIAGSMFVGVVT